ncbi:MAG: hypothetical protein OEZ02_15480 [Anaerolineae bacterium]|nr:hypothetical protein [Anaerolineae bacterium]
MDKYDYLAILEPFMFILRGLGMLILGASSGWFTLETYRQGGKNWQVQIGAYLGFILLMGVVVRYASPFSLGLFGIGLGAAFLVRETLADYFATRKEEGKSKK